MDTENNGQRQNGRDPHGDCYLDMEVDAKTEKYFTGERCK